MGEGRWIEAQVELLNIGLSKNLVMILENVSCRHFYRAESLKRWQLLPWQKSLCF